MKLILFCFIYFSFFQTFSQTPISVAVELGIGPKAKNKFDSSFVNPEHQNTRLMAASFTLDSLFSISKNLKIGLTVRNAISFTADGWSNFNDLMPGSDLPQTGKKFLPGSYDFYTLKSSLQCNIGTSFLLKPAIRFVYSPEVSVYWPITDYKVNSQVFNPLTGFVYTLYDGVRDFKQGEMATTRAAVKFENSFSIYSKFNLFNKSVFGFDFTYHIGTKKVETTYLTFYPDIPQYRAKIHYSQNNSYTSVAIRYYFQHYKRKR